MSEKPLTNDEVRRMANAIGLDRLSAQHIEQLARAANVAQARRNALGFTVLGPADEPAHVFRLID